MTTKRKQKPDQKLLTGWHQISAFLGEPLSVVHRWKKEGMPVHKQGRNVTASSEELNAWMGKESGEPVHIAREDTDLSSELKRGLTFLRHKKLNH